MASSFGLLMLSSILDFFLGDRLWTEELKWHDNPAKSRIKYLSLLGVLGIIVGILWFSYDLAVFLTEYSPKREIELAEERRQKRKEEGDPEKTQDPVDPTIEKTQLQELKELGLVLKYEGDKAMDNLGKVVKIMLRNYLVIAEALDAAVNGVPDFKFKKIGKIKVKGIKLSIGSVGWKSIYNKLKKEAENAAKKLKFW